MALDGRVLSNVSVLAAVVEGGSFVRAAEALGLTPSGVSRAIARLEARIGGRLFDRTTRSLHLTDEGRLLYANINPLERVVRSEEHTSELQSRLHLVCRLLLEKQSVMLFPNRERPPAAYR